VTKLTKLRKESTLQYEVCHRSGASKSSTSSGININGPTERPSRSKLGTNDNENGTSKPSHLLAAIPTKKFGLMKTINIITSPAKRRKPQTQQFIATPQNWWKGVPKEEIHVPEQQQAGRITGNTAASRSQLKDGS